MSNTKETSFARRRAFLNLAIGIAAASLAGTSLADALVEGTNYARLKVPVPVETGKKIEVIEFFSYGCPHCADLEQYLEKLGRDYYTLDALGEEQKLASSVFAAIHGSNMRLSDEKTFFDWAASKGLDRKKVEDMYNSFSIGSKMNRAKQLAQAYNIQSVPTVVVDGKFITASDRVGGHSQLPAAIDELIAKARAERPKG